MSISPWTKEHVAWLVKCNGVLKTEDGIKVELWDFEHQCDPKIMSKWAKHFRNHYCLDSDIDVLRGTKGRKDFLNEIKLPSKTGKPGPSIRAGDFAEILLADFLEYSLDYWVPRVRWSSKSIKNESPKGSDVIGLRIDDSGTHSKEDALFVIESKSGFSKSKANRLQDAINDSAKDELRLAESLHFIKQKLNEKGNADGVSKVERFQNPADSPYQETFGAAAVYSDEFFSDEVVKTSNCSKIAKSKKSTELIIHPKRDRLSIIVIKGKKMMELVHNLFKGAADEA